NMGFNESGEYKKTFIGSGVGTGSVQVLQGVEFEVEPEQHSTHGLFSYREDSNEAAFAVAKVEKIYAHESLTFNNTVACEVISKWKAGLKDDMDARSDVYVFSNGCKKCSNDVDVYYWEYTPVQVLQRKVGTDFVEGTLHTVLEGSLSGTVMWKRMVSCHVYMRQTYRFLWILTTPWEDRSLSWVDQSQAGYMTLTEAAEEAIRLKGLVIDLGFELNIVAGIAIGAS
ncbi:hypothetical protein Tco_1307328, partial [Tanacetum coccineum]